MARGTRKYNTYQEYIQKVVNNCAHSYLILESKDFRQWKINKYYGSKDDLPKGKHIKIIPARCKSYSCPVCGMHKVHELLKRLKSVNFKGYRFFTLTLKNKYSVEDTEKNFLRMSECFNKLNKRLRKDERFKDLEYFRIMEVGKNGMVHMHGIWNKYIPIKELSAMWLKITGDSYRAIPERIKSKGDAIRYLYKYLTKNARFNEIDSDKDPQLFKQGVINAAQLFYENGKRRFQASRNFFSKAEKPTCNYLPYYNETSDTHEIEKVISDLVKQFKLKKEHFDFENYFESEQFLYHLFKYRE